MAARSRQLAAASCLLAAAASLALAAAPAPAAVTWVVKGRGFGHGVGMSQYGAYGYARAGKGYRWILRHYYSGTSVKRLTGPRIVRVLLHIDPGDVEFRGARSACGRRLDPGATYEAHRRGGSVKLRTAAGRLLEGCGARLRAAGNRRVQILGLGPYRGVLEVVPTQSDAGALNAINAVPVNQYVKGVIPHEVPYTWPADALRTQAVAARSYALSAQVDGNGFDLYSDTRSQAYGGIELETPSTTRAASDTHNEVVSHRGEVAQTFYFSTSGGRTESVENSFYGPAIPYLKSVVDRYDFHSPLHTWTLRFSNAEISSRLGGYLRGRLRRIEVTRRGDSPRVVWARVVGTRGSARIRGDNLQYALGGYDRWMSFRRVVR